MILGTPETARGTASRAGQRLAWQEFGEGAETILLLPTWSIVHNDFWRHQLPLLAPSHRVIAFDGLGNGASDRPLEPERYGDEASAEDAVAVMDERNVDHAIVFGSSRGGSWALALAGLHPERVRGVVFISPNVPLAPMHGERVAAAAAFDERREEHTGWGGWGRWNRQYWLEHYPDFLDFFFGRCFTEPGSAAQIAHFFEMGMQTTPDVLLATHGSGAAPLSPQSAGDLARGLSMPSLVIHGDQDAVTPVARGRELARLAGSDLHVLAGSGHEPHVRNPILEQFRAGVETRM